MTIKNQNGIITIQERLTRAGVPVTITQTYRAQGVHTARRMFAHHMRTVQGEVHYK